LDNFYRNLPDIAAQYPDIVTKIKIVLAGDHRVPMHKYIDWLQNTAPEAQKQNIVPIYTLTANLPFFHRSLRDFSDYCKLKEEDFELFDNTFGSMVGDNYKVIKHCLIAGIHYEKGELFDAARHALIGHNAYEDGMHAEMHFSANMILAATLNAIGALKEADKVMAQTETFVSEKAKFLHPNFKALQTGRAICNGDIGAAKNWLTVYANCTEQLPFYQICRHFTTLRAFIALKDFTAAIAFAKRLQALATNYSRPLDQVESGLLMSIALWHNGEKSKAVEQIEQACAIALPYGFVQLFINEGREILPLLCKMRDKADVSVALKQFAEELLDKIYEKHNLKPSIESSPRLSPMRRKMLECINKGMSYGEIAKKAGITSGTVKVHIIALYKQLDVHSAEEAIMKAKMIGLLE
jgi:LuxR family maltose regulon positive regulatory protein